MGRSGGKRVIPLKRVVKRVIRLDGPSGRQPSCYFDRMYELRKGNAVVNGEASAYHSIQPLNPILTYPPK